VDKKVQQIFQVYDKAEQNLSIEYVYGDKEKLQQTFANVYSPGPRYRFVFDFPTRSFDFVSDDFTKLPVNNSPTFSPAFLFNFIHDLLKTTGKNTWSMSDMNNGHQVDEFCIKKKVDINIYCCE
jgi:hypothetical protein